MYVIQSSLDLNISSNGSRSVSKMFPCYGSGHFFNPKAYIATCVTREGQFSVSLKVDILSRTVLSITLSLVVHIINIQRGPSEALNTAHFCHNNPIRVASRVVLMDLGHING